MRFLFFVCLLPLFSASTHKYYVSTTDMFFKPEQNQLQLVVRVFTDDYTASLSRFTSSEIKLDPDQLSETVLSEHMSAYFLQHFQLKSPASPVPFSFVGWAYKQDQTILYASFDSLPKIKPGTYNGMPTFKQYSIPIQIPIVNQTVQTNF